MRQPWGSIMVQWYNVCTRPYLLCINGTGTNIKIQFSINGTSIINKYSSELILVHCYNCVLHELNSSLQNVNLVFRNAEDAEPSGEDGDGRPQWDEQEE